MQRVSIDQLLAAGEHADIPQYEAIMARPATAPLDEPQLPNAFRFTGLRDSRREYAAG